MPEAEQIAAADGVRITRNLGLKAGQRPRADLSPANEIVAFLAPRPPSAQRLGRIGRGHRNHIDSIRREAGKRQRRLNRARREADLELTPRQPFLIYSELQPPVLEQRGPGVVAIPDA